MKAEELRVGNLVSNAFNPPQEILVVKQITGYGEMKGVHVSKINEDFVWSLPELGIIGIPLTKFWLLKFGFIPKEYGYVNQIYVRKPDNRVNDFYFEFDGFDIGKEVELKYVHQLQNLYHALTGEELTIKQ